MRILLLLCLSLPALGTEVQQHVVGGRDAIIASYPHQLSLRDSGMHTCGACLISTTRAVTGAQCTGSAIGVYTVLGGTADRTITNCATCVLRDLNFLSRHPQYDAGTAGIPNDVAVIGFIAVTFNTNLAAITMASPAGGDFAAASCTITGWGRTSPGGALPNILQQGDMIALTNTDCEVTWSNFRITAEHICAYADGISACNGDAGGPLECSDTLAGVTSWGEASCNPAFPTVFTRISSFYAWISAQ